MTQTQYRALWRDLPKLTEEQVTRLLYKEMDGARRPRVIVRLHQRLCILRAKREREALMKELDT